MNLELIEKLVTIFVLLAFLFVQICFLRKRNKFLAVCEAEAENQVEVEKEFLQRIDENTKSIVGRLANMKAQLNKVEKIAFTGNKDQQEIKTKLTNLRQLVQRTHVKK